jgi:hypothetical protein
MIAISKDTDVDATYISSDQSLKRTSASPNSTNYEGSPDAASFLQSPEDAEIRWISKERNRPKIPRLERLTETQKLCLRCGSVVDGGGDRSVSSR